MPHVKFRAVRPPALKAGAAQRIMRNALRTEARHIKKEFEKTTATWDHDVDFREHTHLKLSYSVMSVEVETDDEIYHFVSGGTKPHDIRPKKQGGTLAFQSGYKAKTSPRQIGSRSGGSFGATVFAKAVKHPGTKAREFPEVIRAIRIAPFYKSMGVAWRKAIEEMRRQQWGERI